jgi:hypothetical protein
MKKWHGHSARGVEKDHGKMPMPHVPTILLPTAYTKLPHCYPPFATRYFRPLNMILNIIGLFLITLFFGFMAALVVQKVLHGTLRFHSEWNTTLIACTMTALVSEGTKRGVEAFFVIS